MRSRTTFSMIAVLFAVTLCSHTAASAATLNLSPSGSGSYTLQGIGVDGVAALDITVAYDTASLANPRVQQGNLISGAIMAVNANIPGSVRMGIIRATPFAGSGVIATITFDRIGGSPGKVVSVIAALSNAEGKPLPALVQITNQSPVNAGSSGASEETQAASSAAATEPAAGGAPASQMLPGGIVVSSRDSETGGSVESLPSYDPNEQPVTAKATQAKEGLEPHDASVDPSSPELKQKMKFIGHESVLERFRNHRGERSEKAFLSLFDRSEAAQFKQTPLVALSDGKTAARISLSFPSAEKRQPDFALHGARLVSLKKDENVADGWVIDIAPDKGAYAASMIVSSSEREAIEIPLTIAPEVNVDLDKSGKVTRKDFDLFLKKRGTRKSPAFDLNNDGRRDYIDDYIFTANYIEAGKHLLTNEKQSIRSVQR